MALSPAPFIITSSPAFDARPPSHGPCPLQGQPSPRLLGMWADLFTLALGARGLALLLAPLVCPLPLLQHLALAAYAVQVGGRGWGGSVGRA